MQLLPDGRQEMAELVDENAEAEEEDNENDYSPVFLLMCAYASLGIHDMPISFFVSIASQCKHDFDLSKFTAFYRDFLRFDKREYFGNRQKY